MWFDNSVNRGITYTPVLPPVSWSSVPQVGVNLYNIQYEPNPADVTKTLELARELGAHYVRMQMPWEDVEIHGKGDFEDRRNAELVRSAWEKYDFIFSEAQRLGLEPIVRIDRPPAWARQQAMATPEWQEGFALNGNSTGPPDQFQDFADFITAVVERYDGDGRDDAPGAPTIRFFQIWNEPNLAYEWNWQTPDPAGFLDLLRQSGAAAKAANPNAVIIFPSLAPTDGLDRSAPLSDLDYLDAIYQLGGRDAFDIMSAQAYGLGQPPDEHRYVRLRRPGEFGFWDRPVDTRIDVSRLPLLHEVMVQHEDGEKAIWISEFGYVREIESVPTEQRATWGEPLSADLQAAYTVGQLERARREWPWVGAMNIWFLRWGGYQEANPADPTAGFALVSRDWQPYPVFTAVQQYTAQGAIAGVGAHSWAHPAVQQTATGWQIRFEGTSFALNQPTAGVTLSIDNGPTQAVSSVQGLTDGVHTATISGMQTPAEVFLVGRTPPLPWLWSYGMDLLVLVLMVIGAALAIALVFPAKASFPVRRLFKKRSES